jgi:hypothetical protein
VAPEVALVLSERHYETLRHQLLQEDGLERAGFALLGRSRSVGSREYLVHRLLLPRDRDCRRQTPVSVEPDPGYVLGTLEALQESGAGAYLYAHSHPFSTEATFSGTDDAHLAGEITSLDEYLGLRDDDRDVEFVRLVWGRREEGFAAEVYDRQGRLVARMTRLRVVGTRGVREVACARMPRGPAAPAPLPAARLDRNIRWLGESGQRRLREVRLAVCGAGGIGSAFVAQGRGLGIRRWSLVDQDRVEPSNLNRLFGAGLRDVGRLKVKVLAREIRALDSAAEVETIPHPVQSAEARRALAAADVIVCGLDNAEARLEAQVLAARYLKPLLDMGSGIVLDPATGRVAQMGAQAVLYSPGGACLVCQGVVNPARVLSAEHRALRRSLGYVDGAEAMEAPPSVVTLNALVAALGLEMLVRYLTGFAAGPTYVRYDSLKATLEELAFARREDCPICGDGGVEGLGDDEAARLKPPTRGAGQALGNETQGVR